MATFENKKQHDASEFLISIFENMFCNLEPSFNMDEQIFGGIFQETLECKCGVKKHLLLQKLPEVFMVEIECLNLIPGTLYICGEINNSNSELKRWHKTLSQKISYKVR